MADSLEGIISGDTRIGSIAKTQIVDVISEGEIDGLVTKEYKFDGVVSKTGYDSATILREKSFLASIFFNEVPIVDEQGLFNFQDVNIKESFGTKTGSTDDTTRTSENLEQIRSINERLRGPTQNGSDFPSDDVDYFAKYYRIYNQDCSKAKLNIRITALSTTNTSSGNIEDNTLKVTIQARALFTDKTETYTTFVDGDGEGKLTGRLSGPFLKPYTLNFSDRSDYNELIQNPNFLGWEIKVFRKTPESLTQKDAKTSFVDSLVEVYNNKFSYPNSATVSSLFNAEYFQSVPSRAFDVKLLKVKVPSNYNTLTRTYTNPDSWDGTFKEDKEWTDNPAWCFYDLITNPRYGLGKYISEEYVDKWTLYEIAKYCDVMVPDGYGGVETRFSCNLLVQSREDAFKVMQDMASIFRGLTYFAGGQINATQDRQRTPVYQFTNSNVQNGQFQYSTSSRKVRHNVAIVRYNDKNNFYKPAIEYTEDIDGIRKNGIRETELTAFGCTSRGQAVRLGKWTLATENLETSSVDFKAGIEASLIQPGDVISIRDNFTTTLNRNGGRAVEVDVTGSNAVVTLDDKIDVDADKIYKLNLLTPTYNYSTYNVTDINSSDVSNGRRSQVQELLFQGDQVSTGVNGSVVRSIITFSGGYNFDSTNYDVKNNAVWTVSPTGIDYENSESVIDSTDEIEDYRVISIKEHKPHEFSINAIEYADSKYAIIEDSLDFNNIIGGVAGVTSTNTSTVALPQPPASLSLNEEQLSQNTKQIRYEVGQPNDLTSLAGYEVFVKKDAAWVIADYSGRYPSLFDTYEGNTEAGKLFMETNPLPNDESYVPNREYLFKNQKRPAENVLSDVYVATENTQHYFKVFSVNGIGQYSTDNVRRNINIQNSFPVKDTVISNLRLQQDVEPENQPGVPDNQAIHFTGANPRFLWDASIAGSATEITKETLFKITVREDNSTNNDPSSEIKYQTTGYTSELQIEGSNTFEFDITTNTISFGGVPNRKFEIVVEAHDTAGNSSAGGSFTVDEDNTTYDNKQGYDLARVFNQPVTDPKISLDDVCEATDSFCTKTSVNSNKQVKIEFTKNNYSNSYEGLEGIFVYASDQSFTPADVAGKPQSAFEEGGELSFVERKRLPFNKIVTASLAGDLLTSTMFVGYSLFNKFDEELEIAKLAPSQENLIYDPNYDLGAQLAVSNVEEISVNNPFATPNIPELISIHNRERTFTSVQHGREVEVTRFKLIKPIGKTQLIYLEYNGYTAGYWAHYRGNIRASIIDNFRLFYEGNVIDLDAEGRAKFATRYGTYPNQNNRERGIDYTFLGSTVLGLKGVKFPEGDTEAGEIVMHASFPYGAHGNYRSRMNFVFKALWI